MKFEYHKIDTSGRPIQQGQLDELGELGWALVAIQFDTAYFVREKRQEEVAEPAKTVTRRSEKK
jgi:hypothetical protein